MKFEFEVEVPPVTVEQDRVFVVCGGTWIELRRIRNLERQKLVGGGIGDWVPDYDWRSEYVDKNEDRRGYALPYNTMVRIAKAEAQKRETQRLIAEKAAEMGRGLNERS